MDIFNKAKEAAAAVANVAKQKGEELMHASMDTAGKTKDSVMQTINTLRGQPSQDATTLPGEGPIGISTNSSAPNLNNNNNSAYTAGIPDPNAPIIKPMTSTTIGGGGIGGAGGNFGSTGYQSQINSGTIGTSGVGFGGGAASTQPQFGSGGTGPTY